jgi:hypothetical protein
MGLLESRDRHELPSPGASLLGLTEYAPEDPIEPRPDLGCVPKLVQAEPGTATRLLKSVLRVRTHVRAPRGESQKAIQMWENERVETRVPFGERGADGDIP